MSFWHMTVGPRVEPASTFKLRNRCYRYFYSSVPNGHETWKTERAVEVALALQQLESATRETRVLEVGNVMTQYASGRLPANYTVVDKYEHATGVINEDVVAFDGGFFDLIISISTLEHVGLDERPRDPEKAGRAVSHLRSLLAPGGTMLATWALHYNRDLDDVLLNDSLGASSIGYLKRSTRTNKWTEASASEAHRSEYGWPYICGNAIAVVEWSQSDQLGV
jgi:SAM-dependent methyltransferase